MAMAVDLQLVAVTVASLVAVGVAALILRRSQRKPPQAPPPALNPAAFKPFKLIKKVVVTPDTRIFRFALEHPDQRLGLPVGKHMALRAVIDGATAQRSYTPISSDDDRGYFDLLIKVYFANSHPSFPAGGKLSQYLERMSIGDTIDVRGPQGKFEYLSKGQCSITPPKAAPTRAFSVRRLSMCAGGTGITPILQVIRRILKDPTDPTEVRLLFANQTVSDILLREELDACATDPRFEVWYTLDRPPADWPYSHGFIDQAMVENHLFPPSSDVLALICGPPPMIEHACKPNFAAAGYKSDQTFVF